MANIRGLSWFSILLRCVCLAVALSLGQLSHAGVYAAGIGIWPYASGTNCSGAVECWTDSGAYLQSYDVYVGYPGSEQYAQTIFVGGYPITSAIAEVDFDSTHFKNGIQIDIKIVA